MTLEVSTKSVGSVHLVEDDFWGEVVWRAAQGVCALAAADNLGKAQICHLDVPLAVQQQVLRLQKTQLPSCCDLPMFLIY